MLVKTIVIQDPNDSEKEWVLEITTLFCYGPLQNQYYLFVDGTYFAAKPSGDSVDLDSWTQREKLIHKDFRRERVQPTTFISCKVMMFPSPNNYKNPSFHFDH